MINDAARKLERGEKYDRLGLGEVCGERLWIFMDVYRIFLGERCWCCLFVISAFFWCLVNLTCLILVRRTYMLHASLLEVCGAAGHVYYTQYRSYQATCYTSKHGTGKRSLYLLCAIFALPVGFEARAIN